MSNAWSKGLEALAERFANTDDLEIGSARPSRPMTAGK
jgi:hypothetical protein